MATLLDTLIDIANPAQNVRTMLSFAEAINTISISSGIDFSSAADRLATALTNPASPEYTPVKNALGVATLTSLQSDWTSLQAAVARKLPQPLQPLVQNVSQFKNNATKIPIFSVAPLAPAPAAAASPATAGLSYTLSAQADCIVTSYDTQPDQDLNIVIPTGQLALGIAFDGTAAVKVGSAFNWSWGNISAGADGNGEALLEAYTLQLPTHPLALALINLLPVIPAPGDLTAALNACNIPSFCALQMNITGSLSVDGSLSIKYGVSTTRSKLMKSTVSLSSATLIKSAMLLLPF